MTKTHYTPRGISNKNLLDAFINGKYNGLLKIITSTNQKDKIDFQIRANYVNLYYKGHNLARIKGPNDNVEFDEYYFLTKEMIALIPNIEGMHKVNIRGDKKRNIPPQTAIINQLRLKRDALIKYFKDGKYDQYILNAERIIDKWLIENPRPEKIEQQELVKKNTQYDSTYYILDVEYQVSTLAPFKYIKSDSEDSQVSPRFDIIAVDKTGQLYVIELKKGCNACFGKAGVAAHKKAFDNSIGNNPEPFIKEFKNILSQKQDLEIAHKNLFIDIRKSPLFVYAFAEDENKPAQTIQVFKRICQCEKVGSIPILECKDYVLKMSNV